MHILSFPRLVWRRQRVTKICTETAHDNIDAKFTTPDTSTSVKDIGKCTKYVQKKTAFKPLRQ